MGQLGNGDLLMQQFTAGYRTASGTGPCTFTSAQNVAGIDAMVNNPRIPVRTRPAAVAVVTATWRRIV